MNKKKIFFIAYAMWFWVSLFFAKKHENKVLCQNSWECNWKLKMFLDNFVLAHKELFNFFDKNVLNEENKEKFNKWFEEFKQKAEEIIENIKQNSPENIKEYLKKLENLYNDFVSNDNKDLLEEYKLKAENLYLNLKDKIKSLQK